MTLAIGDFSRFFEDVWGYGPFPWQERLLRTIAENREWPRTLDLPTGSGKTAAIDVAVFHLALEADAHHDRRAPVRIAFVVDRRLIVDDAFQRARRLAEALSRPRDTVTQRVAERLAHLAGEGGQPLIARRLRGGLPREHDWARTPSQPTVLCSTVDQIGSRLLFRGYGVSDSMKPVHAGLLGSDSLILLDEAHLAEPFRQTLDWVETYRSSHWRECDYTAPSGVALLTATPGDRPGQCFELNDDDRQHPVLRKRLEASKPVRLRPAKEEIEKAIVEEVRSAVEHFASAVNGVASPAIAVVVNRVARARTVFELLRKDFSADGEQAGIAEPLLMIGPAREIDRSDLTKRLNPIRTGESRRLERALVIVSTQCLEAGVDIDLDAVISEAAPLDSLRQRFGRLNRAGRDIVPYASIIAATSDIGGRVDDPVYGGAIRAAWQRLTETAAADGHEAVVDFGVTRFTVSMDAEALAPKDDAPILLPAHLDLLTQTSPIPAADPDVTLYLHGPARQPDSISIVWRADIDPKTSVNEDVRRLLLLVPPRSAETIELPIWTVRKWLDREAEAELLADVPARPPDDERRAAVDAIHADGRRAFRWRGDDDSSAWIDSAQLRPGDTIVVPSAYGGLDVYGWDPRSAATVRDVGRDAARPFAGRRFAVRIAPGLIPVDAESLAERLAGLVSARWSDVRGVLLDLSLGEETVEDLERLDQARRGVVADLEVYGRDDRRRPRGVVFVAPNGLRGEVGRIEQPSSTEDDLAGSTPGFRLSLEQHSSDVETKAGAFAAAAGLSPDRIADLRLAGRFHDLGKKDPRFQRWMYFGDPLGADPGDSGTILAKSVRPLPIAAREMSGLPYRWRHEALSVRLAGSDERLLGSPDPDLVLWLVGTHHGYGRPLYPHRDPEEAPPDIGPQSLAFDWRGLDWSSLFVTLKARYGAWELARMEAILRLADHRASEMRAMEVGSQ